MAAAPSPGYQVSVPLRSNKMVVSNTLKSELRAVAALAVPVVVVQLGMMLMGTVDTMMLGRYSKEALAAGALGHTVSFAILAVPLGLFLGLDPLVAQAWGARDLDGVGRHFRRGLILAVVVSIPVSLAMWYAGGGLLLLRQQPEVAALADDYLRALVPGVPAFLCFLVLRQTIQAMSLVWPAVVAVVVSNLVNIVVNFGLVFGRFGLPELGVLGSGLATSLSRWLLAATLLVAGWRRYRGVWGVGVIRDLAPKAHLDLLRIGLPICVHTSLEFWVFGAVGLMMGSLGTIEFGGHQIALNLAALSFMVPAGIAAAAATRVGNSVGRRDRSGATRAAAVALLLGGGVMVLSATVFWTLPGLLSRAYSPDLELVAMASLLIPIAAAFQIADGTQVVAAGILRGVSDTRWAAVIVFAGFWLVGLPGGWVLAFVYGFGPRGLWWGLTAGLTIVAGLLVIRVRSRLRLPMDQLLAERDRRAVEPLEDGTTGGP